MTEMKYFWGKLVSAVASCEKVARDFSSTADPRPSSLFGPRGFLRARRVSQLCWGLVELVYSNFGFSPRSFASLWYWTKV